VNYNETVSQHIAGIFIVAEPVWLLWYFHDKAVGYKATDVSFG
jgi:hypothetical protein